MLLRFLFILGAVSCFAQTKPLEQSAPLPLQVGAEQLDEYLPNLKGKKVGMVVNQTSMLGQQHIVDVLLQQQIKIVKIFSPEHGFRGDADAGEKVDNAKDPKTGITITSLYGDNKKPKREQLQDLDLLVFDMQDVGARFYTYLSTLHYLMEACAENKKPLIVLDRPNPNGDYVDGPIMEPKYTSFVGLHPLPIVHGMTLGELALMINGEKWLKDSIKADITIVHCKNYTHLTPYTPPIKPSPNLPNLLSIRLYPSLGLFEGTVVSMGRGTTTPFQVLGIPDSVAEGFSFTPTSLPGMAKKPLYEGKRCVGIYLSEVMIAKKVDLSYLLHFYETSKNKAKFFNNFFNKLAGNATLQEQVKTGCTEQTIRESWASGLQAFKQKRKKYLLYPDFE